jgi:hypothetical protein
MSGCSASMPALLPAAPQTSAAAAGNGSSQKVRISIDWRTKSTKRDRFTSPSARSVRVDIQGAHAFWSHVVIDKPKTDKITTTAVTVPIGNDAFTFTLFDRRQAAGTKLGGSTVLRKIVAGHSAVIRTTFFGYAAGFTIVSDDKRFAPVVSTGNGLPEYEVRGQAKLTFSVTVTDPDGNVILAPGMPAVTASCDTPGVFTLLRVAGKRNVFTIQATAPIGPSAHVNLLLSAAGAEGVTYTATYPLLENSLILAAAGTGSAAHVYELDTLGNLYPTAGGFPGLQDPVGLAYDNDHHRIYVADAGASTILAYDENGNAVSGWTKPSVPGITGVTYSSHSRNVYASSTSGGGAIKTFDSNGTPAVTPGGFTGLHGSPAALVYEPLSQLVVVVDTADTALPGNPGYADTFTDSGVLQTNFSFPLYDAFGDPFTPSGVSAALNLQGSVWISGLDNLGYNNPGYGADPMVSIANPGNPTNLFAATYLPTFGIIDDVVGQANIGDPISTAVNPVTQDVYVVQAAGPLNGFMTYGNPNGATPVPISGLLDEREFLSIPGVGNFSAAAFTQY